MHIIYSVATCSNRVYKQLFEHSRVKPAYQSQKYHRLLIEGLAANAKVDVVAIPPVNRSCMSQPIVRLGREEEGGATYHHISAVAHPIRKAIHMAFGTFWNTFRLAKKDSVVIVDCLNRVISTSALLASKLRGCRCVGIVMDLPDMFAYQSKFYKAWGNAVIRRCTDYIVLTQLMNEYINKDNKPYIVLEGQADIAFWDKQPSLEKKLKPRVFMYAGGVYRQYGVHLLAEGFLKANIPDARLHIYGPGDYVDEIKRLSEQDSRIWYGGMLMNTEIEDKEQEATFLVNPRPLGEDWVRYSFPSKMMEYIASGTLTLATRISGIPKDYEPHILFIEEDSVDGVAEALEKAMKLTDEEIFDRGMAAREFILTTRNNVVQAKKILDMLEERK